MRIFSLAVLIIRSFGYFGWLLGLLKELKLARPTGDRKTTLAQLQGRQQSHREITHGQRQNAKEILETTVKHDTYHKATQTPSICKSTQYKTNSCYKHAPYPWFELRLLKFGSFWILQDFDICEIEKNSQIPILNKK